jgi:hypothetical protein
MHCMNCIARDNGGYGFHVFTDADQKPRDIHFYNCLAHSQQLRSGFLISLGSGAADDLSLYPDSIFYWNCLSTFQTEGGAGDRKGWRHRGLSISSWVGFTPNEMNYCLSYSNTDGDNEFTDALQVTTTAFITGFDPKFVDHANNDFSLQAASPCVGRGHPSYCPTIDFNGDQRTQVDLGPVAFAPVDTGPAPTPSDLTDLTFTPAGRTTLAFLPARFDATSPFATLRRICPDFGTVKAAFNSFFDLDENL